jgi:3-oxoacyl-[acyl-carrier protein] reductase
VTTSTTISASRAKSLAFLSVHRDIEMSGRRKESVPSLRLRLMKCTSAPVDTCVHGSAGRAASSRMASVRVTSRCSGVPPGQKVTFPSMTSISLRTRSGRLSYCDGALISVGGSPGGTIADTSDDAWRSAFESVFLGAVRLTRAVAASLAGTRENGALSGTGGSIAFVLAASVRAPLPGLAISNGLFPGLAGVVKTLADEHGPSGIRINGLLPVRIATDRVRQLDALLGDPDEVRARISQTIPLRRYGEPAEFGQTAAFVLSPAASYITGAMIPIDGGAIRSF